MRRDYDGVELLEENIHSTPSQLFEQWLEEAVAAGVTDPNSMVLSTVSPSGTPSSRVVLAKDITDRGVTFFTNYDSQKAHEIGANPNVSLLFHWAELNRVVRIEGRAERISDEDSDRYFDSRPRGSRLGAIASPQSQVITSRSVLTDKIAELEKSEEPIKRPANWGGYLVRPTSVEFWQGRPDRVHDRMRYRVDGAQWVKERLAP